MGYLRRVRISDEKGASQGKQEKEAIVTAYVLYCFDARGVVVVQYCFKWGLLYSGGTVQTMHDQTTSKKNVSEDLQPASPLVARA